MTHLQFAFGFYMFWLLMWCRFHVRWIYWCVYSFFFRFSFDHFHWMFFRMVYKFVSLIFSDIFPTSAILTYSFDQRKLNSYQWCPVHCNAFFRTDFIIHILTFYMLQLYVTLILLERYLVHLSKHFYFLILLHLFLFCSLFFFSSFISMRESFHWNCVCFCLFFCTSLSLFLSVSLITFSFCLWLFSIQSNFTIAFSFTLNVVHFLCDLFSLLENFICTYPLTFSFWHQVWKWVCFKRYILLYMNTYHFLTYFATFNFSVSHQVRDWMYTLKLNAHER